MKEPLSNLFLGFILVFCINNLPGQVPENRDSLLLRIEMSKNEEQKVHALNALSNEYISLDLPMALQYAQRALEYAMKAENDELISLSAMNIGNILNSIGMLDHAVEYYSQSIYYKQKMEDLAGEANVLANIAAVYMKLMDWDLSKKYLNKAIDVYKDISLNDCDTLFAREFAAIFNNLGVIAQNEKQLILAHDYYNRGLAFAKLISGQEMIQAMLLNNIGLTYLDQNRPDDALAFFAKALEIRRAMNDKRGIASSYRSFSLYYKLIQESDSALHYLEKAMLSARLVGDNYMMSNLAKFMFDIYNHKQQADSALKYILMVRELDEVINQDEAGRSLMRMELAAKLQEQERIQREARLRQEMRMIFLGVFLFLTIAILGLLFFLTRSHLRRIHLEKDFAELKSKNLQMEKEGYMRELEVKNKELTAIVMNQIRSNEMLLEISQKLRLHSATLKREDKDLISRLVCDLEKAQDTTIWDEFEVRFQSVYNDFYEKLHHTHPDLSPNERRLCAFLKLNMTTKEIGSITGQSQRAIEMARSRLRKKLQLNSREDNLIEYLASF